MASSSTSVGQKRSFLEPNGHVNGDNLSQNASSATQPSGAKSASTAVSTSSDVKRQKREPSPTGGAYESVNEFQLLTHDAINAVTRIAKLVEPNELTERRQHIVDQLNMIVRICFETIMTNAGYSREQARQAGGFVTPFGSYKLDVHSPDSDIDAICVAPFQVTREKFFSTLPKLLRSLSEVDHVRTLDKAFVPVIKFRMCDIDVDLLFARLELPQVKQSANVNSPLIFRAAVHDLKGVFSLNGCRVASALLRMVPSRATFRGVLRYIKAWARARGIYGNVLGYLGGINCAIMVARVCQLFPSSSQSELIVKFFQVYSHWKWPTPVLLSRLQQELPQAPPEEAKLRQQCSLPSKPPNPSFWVWDPERQDDCMPLITPVCPSMNSAHNVTKHTLERVQSEVKRGAKLLNRLSAVQMNSAAAAHSDPQAGFEESSMDLDQPLRNCAVTLHAFSSVLMPVPFIFHYDEFLVVEATSTSDSEFHKQWVGYVETKLRYLVENICSSQQEVADLKESDQSIDVKAYLCTTSLYYSKGNFPSSANGSSKTLLDLEETLQLGTKDSWPLHRPTEMDSDTEYSDVTHVTRYLVGLIAYDFHGNRIPESTTVDFSKEIDKLTKSLSEFVPPEDPDSAVNSNYDIDVCHQSHDRLVNDPAYEKVVCMMKSSLYYERCYSGGPMSGLNV